MIRLTKSGTGEPIYISPEHLVEVRHDEDCQQTLVSIMAGTIVEGWYVAESPQEVVRKVLEWKLAMIDYHHNIPSVKMKAMMELAKLAGTVEEEPNHG